jgi:hypothetical protein
MVVIAIRNKINQSDKHIGISFRRRDQISGDEIWSVFEKVSQSNSQFNALDTLTVEVHAVKMLVGFGGIKTKGRPLGVLAHLKRSIIQVKAETTCLAHALIIAFAKITLDPNYEAYRHGRKIHQAVHIVLATTVINLHNGGGIQELEQFQEHFNQYKIVVSTGLNCESIMFEVQVVTSDRINLLYDDTSRHVIGSLTGAMTKRFVCKACGKGCERDSMHTYDQTCIDCMTSPPCVQSGFGMPCAVSIRHFRSLSCFVNHKLKQGNKKSVSVNAASSHVMNLSFLAGNMNVANTTAKRVKP